MNQWNVLLCDPLPERRDRVASIIRATGGNPQVIEAVGSLDAKQFEGCDPIALVGIGGVFTPAAPALCWIAQTKAAGFRVIVYEDGVKRWPVRSKCLPLLAGAMFLLDSSSADFKSELRRFLDQTFQTLSNEIREYHDIHSLMREHGMVGYSAAITEAFRSALRFSELSDLPVLITGDSGTGKELVARAIARLDPKRKHSPLVTVNCAAISPALMESEFFGHRRGAFTGALRDRKGLIRAAEGGTLFLDEIGELDLGLQSKLLRVLQENCLLGVGEEREVAVDVRFIAATNQDLEQLVVERKFRADLLHRLQVLVIHVPPLRERLSDVPPLIEYFLQKHQTFQPGAATRVSNDYLQALQQADLPGNLRQLENLVRQSLVNHHGKNELDLNDLPVDLLRRLTGSSQQCPPTNAAVSPGPPVLLPESRQTEFYELVKRILDGHEWNFGRTLQECERQIVRAAMDRAGGNQSQAARLLGITPRSVYSQLKKHQLGA